MAKMPYKVMGGKLCVRIEDMDLFRDIIGILKSVALTDDTVLPRLAEIMSKHDAEHEYLVKEDS